MNTLRRNLATSLVTLATWVAASAAAPKVGDLFPDLGKFSFDGSVPDLKGKVVLVDFWASWCGPCRKSFPALQEVYAKFKDKGVVVLGISVDESKTDMDGFLNKNKVEFPIVRDGQGKLAEQLSVNGIPSSFLLDSSGRIVAIHEGYEGDKTKREYFADIEKLLAAK